jgi:hypothetical protein
MALALLVGAYAAATLFSSLILRRSPQAVERQFPVYVAICWGIPLVLTIIPGALGMYGVDAAW